MKIGYYWARRGPTWRIVEVVRGLNGAVLEGGYSVPVGEFDEFTGPMRPPPQSGCKPCWELPPVMAPAFHLDLDED